MKKIACTLSLILVATLGFAQNLTVFNKDGKWGWKDENGKKVVIKPIYEAEQGFNSELGLGIVQLNQKWGMIDKAGNTVIPFEYESLVVQEKGRIAAKKNGKTGFIDKDNKEILPFKYDVIRGSSYGEVYFVKLNGKWGMMSLDLQELNEIKYDKITLFGVNPYVYKGTREGQEYRLDARGQEEASIGAVKTDAPAAAKEAPAKKKAKYTCLGCGAVEIVDSNTKPSPNKTHCPTPRVTNSTSHSWDYTSEVK